MDVITRRMRACPYPCPGYVPGEMPEQEVCIRGAEWYRGPKCPGAVVSEDPNITDVLRDFQAMDVWAKGNSLEWFNAQPAWWTDAIRTCQVMRMIIEEEALKTDE